MTLVTGSPLGSITAAESIYMEGAPSIYFQDYSANPLKNPDADGYYWGMSGTTSYPVFEVGCPIDVSLTENLVINEVRCDDVGVKDTVQQRNYLEFTFTLKSFFPFDTLTHLLKGGTIKETAPENKFGLGKINNNQYWMVYAPKVYDETAGDFVIIHLHRAKFVDAFTINMPFGDSWNISGIKLRAFADTTKPSAQQFATIVRSDPSVIT